MAKWHLLSKRWPELNGRNSKAAFPFGAWATGPSVQNACSSLDGCQRLISAVISHGSRSHSVTWRFDHVEPLLRESCGPSTRHKRLTESHSEKTCRRSRPPPTCADTVTPHHRSCKGQDRRDVVPVKLETRTEKGSRCPVRTNLLRLGKSGASVRMRRSAMLSRSNQARRRRRSLQKMPTSGQAKRTGDLRLTPSLPDSRWKTTRIAFRRGSWTSCSRTERSGGATPGCWTRP